MYRRREKRITELATRRFVKIFILKSAKLLESQSILAFIHECATIIHLQFISDFMVEISPNTTFPRSPSAVHSLKSGTKALYRMSQDHGTQSSPASTPGNVSDRMICWESVKRQRPYHEVISSFRTIWMEALIEFYKLNGLNEKYGDINKDEFKENQPEIPEFLRLELADFGTLLGRKELGLGQAYRPPLCWLSLYSNPFLLFIQSLIPYSVIDHQGWNLYRPIFLVCVFGILSFPLCSGIRTQPLTFISLLKYINQILINPLIKKVNSFIFY